MHSNTPDEKEANYDNEPLVHARARARKHEVCTSTLWKYTSSSIIYSHRREPRRDRINSQQ